MKLFIITCLKDYQDDVLKIYKQAQIAVFSVTDVTGFKNGQSQDLQEDWFASGDEKFDSLVIFSFTGSDKAELGLELVKQYNKEYAMEFPLRAFIVPVEKSNL